MTIKLLIGVIAWVCCGILAAGWLYPDFEAEHRDPRKNLGASLLLGIVWGPAMTIVAFCMTGFGQYGWRLR